MSRPCENCGSDLNVCKNCDFYNNKFIEILEGATNGDMIRALFPDVEKTGGMIGATEYSNEHMSIVVNNAWWNKLYKEGDAE